VGRGNAVRETVLYRPALRVAGPVMRFAWRRASAAKKIRIYTSVYESFLHRGAEPADAMRLTTSVFADLGVDASVARMAQLIRVVKIQARAQQLADSLIFSVERDAR
jgi:hypothetical protein